MRTAYPDCSKCQSALAQISYPDLVGVRGKVSEPTLLSVLEPLLQNFDFYVCPNCGLTALYAPSQVVALAKDIVEERGGHA
jgi:hypothetical protein